MIEVKVKKLTPKRGDFDLETPLFNEAAVDFAKIVAKEVRGFQCEECTNKDSTLLIIADRKKSFRIKKNFCCTEFEKTVDVYVNSHA